MSRGPEGFGSGKADLARGLSLAFEFAGAVFIFWFIGRLIDNRLGIEPWAQVVGAVLGWGGGFLHVYYASQRLAGPDGRASSEHERPTGRSEGSKTGEADG